MSRTRTVNRSALVGAVTGGGIAALITIATGSSVLVGVAAFACGTLLVLLALYLLS